MMVCPGGPAWLWRLCTAGCRCGSTPTSPPPCTRWPGTRAWCTTSSTPASGHTILFCDWLIMKILCPDWLTAPAPGCPRATPAWRWPSPSGSRRRRTPSRSGGGQSWTRGHIQITICYLQILLQILSNGSVISVYSVCQYSPLQIDKVYITVWLNRYPVKCKTHYK